MKRIILYCMTLMLINVSCQKNVGYNVPKTPKDTLLVYAKETESRFDVISRNMSTGVETIEVKNSKNPFVLGMRMVCIKDRTNLLLLTIYGRSRQLATFNNPSDPRLSIDLKQVILVDSTQEGKYKLMMVDTSGTQTLLRESYIRMFDPTFMENGAGVYFSQKNSDGSSGIYRINYDGTQYSKITSSPDCRDFNPVVIGSVVYFIRQKISDGSSDIFSTDLTGTFTKRETNYSLNDHNKYFTSINKATGSKIIATGNLNGYEDIYTFNMSDAFANVDRFTTSPEVELHANLVLVY